MNDQKVIIECQYFPSIGWMALACHEGRLYVDQSENYNKRSLRNKAYIGGCEDPVVLSVPLKKGKHSGKNITSVEISYDKDWRLNHLRAIQSVYGKSPYFIHFIDAITDLINASDSSLFNINMRIASRLNDVLHLEINFYEQQDFESKSRDGVHVLRDQFRYTGDCTTIEDQIGSRMKRIDHTIDLPFTIGSRSSILDLLFYLGPECRIYLRKLFS